MKEKIHPEFFEITATCVCGANFTTYSTKKSGLNVEVCSVCHPFYTGKKKETAQAGQVEKFRKRAAKAVKTSSEKKESSSVEA
ncbi:MAG: 50S ribosomal protein L31 [Armatimonadota bacterium]